MGTVDHEAQRYADPVVALGGSTVGHVRAVPLLLYAFGAAMLMLSAALALTDIAAGDRVGLVHLVLALIGCASLATGWEASQAVGAGTLPGLRRALDLERVRQLTRHGAIAAQLGLLVLVMRQFRIESPAFYEQLTLLTLIGFVIHAALPMRQRLTFFVLLSLSGIWLVFGFLASAALIGIGLGLIAICHLPIDFRARVALLVAAGVCLAVFRAEIVAVPIPGAIWPILGSMFMFRLITYMYDLRHARERPDFRRTLAYFFLLPNVAFPLFPVVDFTTFRRTYYDQDAIRIYQRGVQWMARGVIHLLLYRIVYLYLMIPADEVTGLGTMARHMVANFLLYLKVSGQFHLIVGMLHLFGFRLPETHHFFYLASSLTDFWRRINIYWKDFMMKVVYYPAFFRLRRFGTTAGIVAATLVVFFGTWLLHAYQWFWLLGTFLLTVPDVLFWGILAMLLVANTLYESKHGRKRTIEGASWSPASFATHSLKVAGTFTLICVLWSLWSSESVGEWLALWRSAFAGDAGLAWRPEALLLSLVAVGMVARSGPGGRGPGRREPSFLGDGARTAAVIGLIYVVGTPAFAERVGDRGAALIRDVRIPQLSKRDADQMQRGYYENLTGVNRFNGELWQLYARRPSQAKWPNVYQAGLARQTDRFDRWELLPLQGTMFHGAPFRTNRWGMRDRDYEKTPPDGTYRIALLGASYVMGDGVGDNETFEWLVEERLARERAEGEPAIEILNFGMPSFFPARHLDVMHRKVFDFQPDAIFMVSHRSDAMDYADLLVTCVELGWEIPFDFLRVPVEAEGITADMPRAEALRRLEPYAESLLAETYARIVADSRARGILPVWVAIPTPNETDPAEESALRRRLAEQAGFTILDLSDVYDGEDLRSLWLVEWDFHPNARGHELIADRLYRALREDGTILPRRLPESTSTNE